MARVVDPVKAQTVVGIIAGRGSDNDSPGSGEMLFFE
jgi:hypothetical protein